MSEFICLISKMYVCGGVILTNLRQMSFFSCKLNGKGFCLCVLCLNLCQAGVLINIDYIIVII